MLTDCAALAAELGDGRLPVGIGLCELVDLEGRPASAHTVDWRELDPAVAIDAPRVVVESDLRAAALAEARFGAGRRSLAVPLRDRRDGRERLPRRRRPPLRRRARRGPRARCATGRGGGERPCARPRGRSRAGRGRPRGSGARAARRRRRGGAGRGARRARERARPVAGRPRRRARRAARRSASASSACARRSSHTRALPRFPSSAPRSPRTVAWSERLSWHSATAVRLRVVLDGTGLWRDVEELPSSVEATLADTTARRGATLHDRSGAGAALLGGQRAPRRRQRERRLILRRGRVVAGLARGARRRPRGRGSAERPARIRRIRLAAGRRPARRLVVRGIPRPGRGDRRRRTDPVRSRHGERGLDARARGQPRARSSPCRTSVP